MAAPNLPVISYLGTLQLNTGTVGSPVWADIGQAIKFAPPKMKVGDSKNSYLQQANPWHTYQPGWGEPGVITFEINMRQSDFNTLFNTYFSVRKQAQFRIRYNDGTTSTSGSVLLLSSGAAGVGDQCYINELGDGEVSRDTENPIMTSGSIKVSGLPTYTAAT